MIFILIYIEWRDTENQGGEERVQWLEATASTGLGDALWDETK